MTFRNRNHGGPDWLAVGSIFTLIAFLWLTAFTIARYFLAPTPH